MFENIMCWLPILLGMLLSALLTWWYLKNKYRAQYQPQIDHLTSQNKGLQSDLTASKQYSEQLSKQNDGYKTEINGLTNKVTTLETEHNQLQTTNNELTTTNSTLKTKLATLTDKNTALTTQVDGLNDDISNLNGKITSLDAQLIEAKTQSNKSSLLGNTVASRVSDNKDADASMDILAKTSNQDNTDSKQKTSLFGSVMAAAGAGVSGVAAKLSGNDTDAENTENKQSLFNASDDFDADAAKNAFGKKIKQDDLTIIEGIGPKIQELFHAASITTWGKLANTPVDVCKKILTDAGSHFEMHDPTTWPEQARLAAKGKWKKLVKWQDELDGGKK